MKQKVYSSSTYISDGIVIPQLVLSPKHERAWDNLRSLMHIAVPHFGYVFYEMLSPTDKRAVFTDLVPVAATDGVAMLINPYTFFENYDPGEQLFIGCHEIDHNIFGHPQLFHTLRSMGHLPFPDGSKLPWIEEVGQMAADYQVNAVLVEGRTGKKPDHALYDTNIASVTSSFFDSYRNLMARMLVKPPKTPPPGVGKPGNAPPDPQGGSQTGVAAQPGAQQPPDPGGPPAGSQGQPAPDPYLASLRRGVFDQVLQPGTSKGQDPNQAAKERNDAKWRRVIEHAADISRQQGRLPGNIERVLRKSVEPDIDWREKLHATLSRSIGRDAWTYENPDQEWAAREIYVPGRSGFGAADVVVGGDVSGSVSDEELAMANAVISSMLEQLKPRRLFVLWCDTRITRVDELQDVGDLARLKNPHGGGGTRFTPVFEWVEKNQRPLNLQVDGLVYVTDLEGLFPTTRPDYPVVWASVSEPRSQVPFGEVVRLPRKGQARGRY